LAYQLQVLISKAVFEYISCWSSAGKIVQSLEACPSTLMSAGNQGKIQGILK